MLQEKVIDNTSFMPYPLDYKAINTLRLNFNVNKTLIRIKPQT